MPENPSVALDSYTFSFAPEALMKYRDSHGSYTYLNVDKLRDMVKAAIKAGLITIQELEQ